MKKIERIKAKIEANKELIKSINKEQYPDLDSFIESGLTYIKAIKESRMICSIDSVSQSGMSRTMKFLSCEKATGKRHYHRNYFSFFNLLGFSPVKDSNYFRINGCGMDMVFHTNYTIIHQLHRLGFINKKQCASLAQETPSVI